MFNLKSFIPDPFTISSFLYSKIAFRNAGVMSLFGKGSDTFSGSDSRCSCSYHIDLV